ncbi:MAG: AAA family ATPase, partial [Methanosarcinales archaeon]|nr:AAA family ATPase [Methanosarcinales archaeon]
MDLKIKNIGGLAGTHDYDLKPGVNRITGPNASGKSSLIRGIECLVTDDNDLFR